MHGLELVVRLHDAEVEFATADTVDVGHAAAAGGRVALDAVLSSATVEETADRLTGYVINAGLAAGADGDELLFGLYGAAQGDTCKCSGQGPCQGFTFHGSSPFLFIV